MLTPVDTTILFDPETLIARIVWNILVNDDGWKSIFDRGNQLTPLDVEGSQRATKLSTNDGDYPECFLRSVGGTDAAFTSDPTFETHSEEGPSRWTLTGSVGIRIYITAELNSEKELNQALAMTRTALRKKGPRLGSAAIEDHRMSWTSGKRESILEDDQRDEGTDSKSRERGVISLSIDYRVEGGTALSEEANPDA